MEATRDVPPSPLISVVQIEARYRHLKI